MDGLYPSKTSAESDTETESSDQESPESVDEEADSEPTALIPKSALSGYNCKEGDTITMKIVKDYGDEYEVVPTKGMAETKPRKSMMQESNDELDSMDRKMM